MDSKVDGKESDRNEKGSMKRNSEHSRNGQIKRQKSKDGPNTPHRERSQPYRQCRVRSPNGTFYCQKKGLFSFVDVADKDFKSKIYPNTYPPAANRGSLQPLNTRCLLTPTRYSSNKMRRSCNSFNETFSPVDKGTHYDNKSVQDSPEEDALSLEGDDVRGKTNDDYLAHVEHTKTAPQSQTDKNQYCDQTSSQSSNNRQSGYGSFDYIEDVIDTDTILAQNTEQVHLPSPPPNMPKDCPDNLLSVRDRVILTKKPDQTDSLIVKHPLSTDCELGDFFGAKCETFVGKEYNCHRFKDVDPRSNTPAAVMKIMDKDELVFINDMFAPAKNHTDILNIFHHVKVDGKTPFILIIRRKAGKKSVKWQWYKSTAILVPDSRKIPYAAPATLSFTPLRNNSVEHIFYNRYKVDYGAGLFLFIEGSRVGTRTLQHDDKDITTTITKHVWLSQGNGDGYIYYCHLRSHDDKTCLSLDKTSKTVVVGKRESNPFQWGTDGHKIYFQCDGEELFLGFEDNKVTCTSRCYMFEEIPASIGQDHCDFAASMSSKESVDSGYSTLQRAPFLRGSSFGLSSLALT